MKKPGCSLCQSQSYNHLFHQTDMYGIEVSLVVCEKCGVEQLYPRRTEQELEEFYSSEYYRNYSMDDKRLNNPNWLERKNRIACEIIDAVENHKKIKGARLLDIGSSYGFLLQQARDRGCNAFGIEPEVHVSETTSVRDENVFTGTLQNYLDTDYKPFEIIILSHVLEHVSDPVDFMLDVRKLLQPEGLVCVEVPNSTWAREFGRYPYNTHSAHLYYFTKKTLTTSLELSGFDPVSTSYGLDGATVRIVAGLGKQKKLSEIVFPIENPKTVIGDTRKSINRLNPSLFKRIFIFPNLTTRVVKRLKREFEIRRKRILK